MLNAGSNPSAVYVSETWQRYVGDVSTCRSSSKQTLPYSSRCSSVAYASRLLLFKRRLSKPAQRSSDVFRSSAPRTEGWYRTAVQGPNSLKNFYAEPCWENLARHSYEKCGRQSICEVMMAQMIRLSTYKRVPVALSAEPPVPLSCGEIYSNMPGVYSSGALYVFLNLQDISDASNGLATPPCNSMHMPVVFRILS